MDVKKVLQYFGLMSLLIVAGLLSIFAIKKDVAKQQQEPTCSNLSDNNVINSKRSLGLIVKDRKVLALRLDTEGNYSAPGGHIDFGESPESSLSRELKEEINIITTSEDFEFFKVDCESNKKEKEKILFYLVKSWQGEISTITDDDKLSWVNYNFEANKKADTDLKLALYHLKEAGLID